jgi:hypothetical protein
VFCQQVAPILRFFLVLTLGRQGSCPGKVDRRNNLRRLPIIGNIFRDCVSLFRSFPTLSPADLVRLLRNAPVGVKGPPRLGGRAAPAGGTDFHAAGVAIDDAGGLMAGCALFFRATPLGPLQVDGKAVVGKDRSVVDGSCSKP